MNSFPIIRHMLPCAILMINAQVLTLPAELDDLHTVTKTIYHTTVRRRSGGAVAHLGFDGHREMLTPLHLIQRRNTDTPDDLAYALNDGALPHTDLEGLSKRSDSHSTLRIPFVEQDGYIALYLSNTTATPFCKNISDTLYQDNAKVFLELKVDLDNSTTKIPVREDKAINFNQSAKEGEEKSDKSFSTTKTTSPKSEASKTTDAMDKSSSKAESDDESKTPKTSTASKANKSTTPKSADATSTDDQATLSEVATTDPSDAEASDTTTLSTLQTQARKASPASTKAPAKSEASEASTKPDSSPTIISAPKKTVASTLVSSNEPAAKPKSITPSMTEISDNSSLNLEQSTASKTNPSSTLSGIASQAAEKSAKESEIEADSFKKAFNNDPPTFATDIRDRSQATPAADLPAITAPPSITDAAVVAATGPYPTLTSINFYYDHVNSYMHKPQPHPTPGAALRVRVFENSSPSRLVTWWRRERKPVPKRDEVDIVTLSSSWRIPAKLRPTSITPPPRSSTSYKTRPTSTATDSSEMAKPSQFDTPTTSSPPLFHPSPFKPPSPSPTIDIDTTSFYLPKPTSSPSPPKPPSTKPPSFRPPHHNPHPPSSPSIEAITTIPHDASSAWSHITDPRMRWMVGMLWVLGGLQVLMGVWEFVKGMRGRAKTWEMWRVKWVESEVRKAG